MSEGKTSISNASSYEEAGEYWDEHDLGEVWEQTQAAEFEVNFQTSIFHLSELELCKEPRGFLAKV